MRIGIDCRTMLGTDAKQIAGTSHYTYHLVKNLLAIDTKNEYILFFHRLPARVPMFSFLFEAKNVKLVVFPWYGIKPYVAFVYAHLFVPMFLGKYKLDVYHNPSPFIPLFYGCHCVMTVHDMTSFTHPQWFDQSWFRRLVAKYMVFPWSVKKATQIICVSQTTKQDLCKTYPVSQKSTVIPLGVEPLKVSQEKQRYIFFVGTIEPRKNLASFIRAYRAYTKQVEQPYRFIMAGQKGWKYQEVEEEIHKGGVEYRGYVDQRQKEELLRNASLFVFPSLYEGFGLPILEAMASGTPVLTSDRGSLPEVGGDAAYYIHPDQESEMTHALMWLLHTKEGEQKRSVLMQKGLEQARRFSWKVTAQKTLEVYQKMA